MQRGVVDQTNELFLTSSHVLHDPPPPVAVSVLLHFFVSLKATREDVKAEVMKAPKRRIDNVITRLTDSVHLLQVHTTASPPTFSLPSKVGAGASIYPMA